MESLFPDWFLPPILPKLPSRPGRRCDNTGNAEMVNMNSSIYVNILFNAVSFIHFMAKIPEISSYLYKKLQNQIALTKPLNKEVIFGSASAAA